MLAGQWCVPGFVPPVFSEKVRASFLSAGEAELLVYGEQIAALEGSVQRHEWRRELNYLQQQRDEALQALKQVHRQRKAVRQEQRHELRQALFRCLSDDSQKQRVQQIKAQIAALSFQSQHDRRERQALKKTWNDRLDLLQSKLGAMEQEMTALKAVRRRASRRLQKKVFAGYRLCNRAGQRRLLSRCFPDRLPPAGAGDCAAPKLLQYAHLKGLRPVAMAEFWWGASPPDGVRHHGRFYPACRGKCRPILSFMLEGMEVEKQSLPVPGFGHDAPDVVYEDEHLLLVNKPAGLLSVPGKEIKDSVLTRLQARYPDADGPLLVHRLDMSTSGLLLAAKNRDAHKNLQRQFMDRHIEKRYAAVLSKPLSATGVRTGSGTISLPLRVDLDDRPRQLVCHEHGKVATTHWKMMEEHEDRTRVWFYPVTGRTHQLRVHAAHHLGLASPIVGDELYGNQRSRAERLLLHAQRLRFTHPVSGRRIETESPVPF